MEAYCVNFLFKRNRIKYIPNDLIKFKGKLYEIIEADEYFVKIWYKGGKKPKYLRVRVNDVTPIPLSDDVFRVNEWRLVNFILRPPTAKSIWIMFQTYSILCLRLR